MTQPSPSQSPRGRRKVAAWLLFGILVVVLGVAAFVVVRGLSDDRPATHALTIAPTPDQPSAPAPPRARVRPAPPARPATTTAPMEVYAPRPPITRSEVMTVIAAPAQVYIDSRRGDAANLATALTVQPRPETAFHAEIAPGLMRVRVDAALAAELGLTEEMNRRLIALPPFAMGHLPPGNTILDLYTQYSQAQTDADRQARLTPLLAEVRRCGESVLGEFAEKAAEHERSVRQILSEEQIKRIRGIGAEANAIFGAADWPPDGVYVIRSLSVTSGTLTATHMATGPSVGFRVFCYMTAGRDHPDKSLAVTVFGSITAARFKGKLIPPDQHKRLAALENPMRISVEQADEATIRRAMARCNDAPADQIKQADEELLATMKTLSEKYEALGREQAKKYVQQVREIVGEETFAKLAK